MKIVQDFQESKADRIFKSIVGSKKNLSKENKETIKKFMSFCLADGVGVGRIEKYLYHLRKFCLWSKKNLLELTKDDVVNLVGKVETLKYSPYTKKDIKISIKKFLKVMKGNNEEYPKEVKWIKTNVKNNQKKMPEELLTEEEVAKMIRQAPTFRDKAIISLLWETGMRRGEMLTLKVKHVQFDDIGGLLVVTGKTGPRRLRIITTVPYLHSWLEIHPTGDDPEAPLFTSNRGKAWKETAIKQMLKNVAKQVGIKKRVHPHLFRHSRATYLSQHMTEAQLKSYFGWVQDSKQCATYILVQMLMIQF